jgi:PAS domain S-box-containing protein
VALDWTVGSGAGDLYRSLFENNHAVMLLIDPDTAEVVDGNPAACAFYRYTRSEMRALRISDINTLSDSEVRHEMARAVSQRRQYFNFRHRLATGEIRSVEVYSGPIVVQGRQLLYSIVHDVTDRMRAEEALSESEARYRAMFDQVPTCIAVYAAIDGGVDFLIIDFNSAAQRAEKIAGAEVIGRRLSEVFPGAEAMGFVDLLRAVSATGRPQSLGPRWYEDERIQGWRENHVYRLPTGELVCVYQDVTDRVQAEEERRQLEERMRRTQRLESMGVLAGGIAHDFNNILSSISGFTELVAEATEPGTEVHDNLRYVIAAAGRAKDLVAQILAFSRQAGATQQTVNFDLIVKEALALARASVPSTIAFNVHIDKGVSAVVGDPTQLHQVILNLVTNAAQAMEGGTGELTVALAEVSIGPEDLAATGLPPGEYLRLDVSDTGPGVPPEIRERIFDPFFTTKSQGQGTGLGLAMVHGIVSSHGGAVTLDSTPGEGSTFTVYLPPIHRVDSPIEPEGGPPPRGSEHIIVVDDEPDVVEMARLTLASLGYRVTPAEDPVHALDLIRKDPQEYDLLFTDQTMPGMTGVDLAEAVERVRPDLPVLLTTGFAHDASSSSARLHGAGDILAKPYTMRQLARAVRDAMDGDGG